MYIEVNVDIHDIICGLLGMVEPHNLQTSTNSSTMYSILYCIIIMYNYNKK